MNESTFNVEPFRYDPNAGIITRDGKPVGSANGRGYLLVQCEKVRVTNHRLAWRLQTGAWPIGEIDHIDGNTGNNRWENLRLATSSQNKMNRRCPRNNRSGEAGVFFDNTLKRWRVTVSVMNSKRQMWYASHFPSAVCAARLIRRLLHGDYQRSTI